MTKVAVGEVSAEKYIEKPDGGWVPNSLYEVKAAWSKREPVYVGILFTGKAFYNSSFTSDAVIWSPTRQENDHLSNLWYLEVVKVIRLDFDRQN